MPDNTAIVQPTTDLLSLAKEYRNIEVEISEIFFKQKQSVYDIVGIQKNIDKGLMARITRQHELLNIIKKSKEAVIEAEKKTQLLSGKDRVEAKLLENSLKQQLKSHMAEYEVLGKINRQVMIPWIYFLTEAWNLFKSMDKAAFDFRMKMGVFRNEVGDIRIMAQQLAIDFMHVGVTIDGAYTAILALGKEMGSIRTVSKDLVKTTALLKAQLGVSEEDSARFFRNMAAVSKTTMQTQENMAYVAYDLAQAAGVPLPEVMSDVAKMSSTTLTMVSRVPNQILRAAIEAKRLNTSLGDIAKSSREILNFSDNIAAEMEASVLLGRSINLHKARELAYHRDLIGSTKEILRLTRSINFENLDVFQQEAFARATGKSVDELLRMVQAEKQWNLARTSGDPKIRAQVEAYDKLLRLNEAQAKARAKDIGAMVQQEANQQRLTAITQKWNQVVAKAAEVFLPVLDALLSIVPVAIDIGVALTKWFIIGKTLESAMLLIPRLTKIGTILSWVASIGKLLLWPFKEVAGVVPKILGFLGPWGGLISRFIGPFMKFIPGLGWIITAFQFLSGFIRGFTETSGGFWSKLWGGFVGGLTAVVKPVFDLLVWPFKKAWELIKPWLGFSASTLGLAIVKGLVSVGAMMFDALTSPWRRALAWIFDKIPGMGKVADKLRGGLTDILNKPVEAKVAAAYVPAVTVTPKGTTLAGATPATEAGTAAAKDTTTMAELLAANKEVVAAINGLRADLNAGKIGISMDGQLLSATLARQTEFRGGYGVNKV